MTTPRQRLLPADVRRYQRQKYAGGLIVPIEVDLWGEVRDLMIAVGKWECTCGHTGKKHERGVTRSASPCWSPSRSGVGVCDCAKYAPLPMEAQL